jgi:hypothetical protein
MLNIQKPFFLHAPPALFGVSVSTHSFISSLLISALCATDRTDLKNLVETFLLDPCPGLSAPFCGLGYNVV